MVCLYITYQPIKIQFTFEINLKSFASASFLRILRYVSFHGLCSVYLSPTIDQEFVVVCHLYIILSKMQTHCNYFSTHTEFFQRAAVHEMQTVLESLFFFQGTNQQQRTGIKATHIDSVFSDHKIYGCVSPPKFNITTSILNYKLF